MNERQRKATYAGYRLMKLANTLSDAENEYYQALHRLTPEEADEVHRLLVHKERHNAYMEN